MIVENWEGLDKDWSMEKEEKELLYEFDFDEEAASEATVDAERLREQLRPFKGGRVNPSTLTDRKY